MVSEIFPKCIKLFSSRAMPPVVIQHQLIVTKKQQKFDRFFRIEDTQTLGIQSAYFTNDETKVTRVLFAIIG